MGVFEKYESRQYPYRYQAKLAVKSIAGGCPADPKVAEGHIKRKIAASDDLIRAEVAEMMVERGLPADEAAETIAGLKGLVVFRTDPEFGLWIPGANLKACLKEAASIAAAAGRLKKSGWGKTSHNKGILSWLAEHVFVVEDRLYLGVTEPTEVAQSFIHKTTPKGPVSAIQYTEVVRDCEITCTVETDQDFSEEEWAAIWLTAEHNGLGAARKMGYGLFEVVEWSRVGAGQPTPALA